MSKTKVPFVFVLDYEFVERETLISLSPIREKIITNETFGPILIFITFDVYGVINSFYAGHPSLYNKTREFYDVFWPVKGAIFIGSGVIIQR